MVKRQPVNVKIQILLGIVPIAWIWALYRIEKLRIGLVIFIPAGFGISIGLEMLTPFPYGYVTALAGNIILWIYFVRKWSIEWNRKVAMNS